ncbi:cdc42 effector protein 3 isoform 1-T3 [Anableps anableps]
MPAKTPIYLKTTTPKKGKKLRLRDVLSGDMISPPLGDVRHSAHVGPEGEGDMFGDVGFLQGKMDMLPSLGRPQNGHARSHSIERHAEDGFATKQEAHSYAYNGFHDQHPSNGLLKNTVSMPVCIAHEQAPPKPPRLHLDDPAPPSVHPQQHPEPSHRRVDDSQHQPCRDISVPSTMRRLVPSSGSFSEVSSEDSMSETCGPPDVRRGLSLDSDAGLSNEDLRSEHSDSPCPAFHPAAIIASSGVPRSDSMARLDLDLGPSILEDVLSIMDRYKTEDDRCEL